MKYANLSADDTLRDLKVDLKGLSDSEAKTRKRQFGPNQLKASKVNALKIFWRQLAGNTLSIILICAALVSFFTGDKYTAYYVIGMILVSVGLGFINEFSAERTVAALLKRISLIVLVMRNGKKSEISVSDVTVGDIVLLSPGSIIPADIRLIASDNLEIDESALTGESVPVTKDSTFILENKSREITKLVNIGFMGTEVVSGSGIGVVIQIGRNTEFGKIAEISSFVRPQTKFQEGLAGFGVLIVRVIFALTLVIFLVNALLGHYVLTSLLFALAVAVGLTPELLPIIVTVGLARGAGKLAKKEVITKQLIAIENLGNMDILCTDKTGTLTEGNIQVVSHLDENGESNPEILTLSLVCNSAVLEHKIVGNTIDVALWQHAQKEKISLDKKWHKIFEEPFDYSRQFMFSVAQCDGKDILIAKGAPEHLLKLCKHHNLEHLVKWYEDLSSKGLRVIAVATKTLTEKKKYDWEDARDLKFEGFISFSDTPKDTAREALLKLAKLNVDVKLITGDSDIVARAICQEVGMNIKNSLTGAELEKYKDDDLKKIVAKTNLFARVSPEQKLIIIKILRDLGHTVGFLGDGVNDAPSLHSADVGISVNSAVDVAKEAAQIVLLRKGLDVIANGIQEGRKTFMNTIKYILMGTGSNFGEMLSAAGASFFLPFLPMTPAQILLENGLYDISQVPIASDNVDEELLTKPKHWDIGLIYRFMFFFGLLSAFYTFMTFGVMLHYFHASGGLFQTGWFIESLVTEMIVVLVVRTIKVPFFKSHPNPWLVITSLTVLALGLFLPFSPLAHSIGFVVPPAAFYIFIAVLMLSYIFVLEIVKKWFNSRFSM